MTSVNHSDNNNIFKILILISGSASTAVAVHEAIESKQLANIEISKIITNSPRISGIRNLIRAGFPEEKIKAIDKKEINSLILLF